MSVNSDPDSISLMESEFLFLKKEKNEKENMWSNSAVKKNADVTILTNFAPLKEAISSWSTGHGIRVLVLDYKLSVWK